MQRLLVIVIAALGAACGARAVAPADAQPAEPELQPVPIVGLPCEGCEAVFEGLPSALDWQARIAPADEPGAALRIEGTVFDQAARPVPGTIVYAYQTNAQGIYPTDDSLLGSAAHRHGRLRGWARTDAAGRYRFDTIRPAGYPGTDLPAHVHMHIIEPGRCTYYIDDVMFTDDPRLTEANRHQLTAGRGGAGIATPERAASGAWSVTRDIVLGAGIPGYPPRTDPPLPLEGL